MEIFRRIEHSERFELYSAVSRVFPNSSRINYGEQKLSEIDSTAMGDSLVLNVGLSNCSIDLSEKVLKEFFTFYGEKGYVMNCSNSVVKDGRVVFITPNYFANFSIFYVSAKVI